MPMTFDSREANADLHISFSREFAQNYCSKLFLEWKSNIRYLSYISLDFIESLYNHEYVLPWKCNLSSFIRLFLFIRLSSICSLLFIYRLLLISTEIT